MVRPITTFPFGKCLGILTVSISIIDSSFDLYCSSKLKYETTSRLDLRSDSRR